MPLRRALLASLLLLCVACDKEKPAAPAPAAPAPAEPVKPAEASAPAAPPQIPEVELPTFTEVPEGERAPSRQALTFTVGATTQAQAQEFVAQHKLTCRDTGARAMFVTMHDKYKGKGPAGLLNDLNYVNKAKNPQIRLACERTPSGVLTDRQRVEGSGRLLLTFDSDKHPLRSASYTRLNKDIPAATADLEATIKAVQATYGKPAESEGSLGKAGLEEGVSVRRVWSFADLTITISGAGLGKNGAQIEERYEIPMPVRSDAPAQP